MARGLGAILIGLLLACGPVDQPAASSDEVALTEPASSQRYAIGFALHAEGPSEIRVPWQTTPIALPSQPIRTVATTSTTELGYLVALGLEDRLVGHVRVDLVSSAAIHRRAEAGEVIELGTGAGTGFDLEKVLAAGPDVLLVDAASDHEMSALSRLEDAGIVLLPVPAFLEPLPLGRAEWLLLIGRLFGVDQQAEQLFADIERDYLELQHRATGYADEHGRPTVFTGGPWQDAWHVPAGGTFAARVLADAGADYLWSDVKGQRAVPLDVETVYARAIEADIWLYPSHWRTLGEIRAADSRFGGLAAVRHGRVVQNDLRTTPTGGNDFWETGAVRADLVLADLVAIFHPELLPGHQLYYHRTLPTTVEKR